MDRSNYHPINSKTQLGGGKRSSDNADYDLLAKISIKDISRPLRLPQIRC